MEAAMIQTNIETHTVTTAKPYTAYSLVISWILLGPLIYFASNGSLWFQNEKANNVLASRYGALAVQAQDQQAQVIAIGILGIVLCLCTVGYRSVLSILRRNLIFGALAGLAVLSSAWSQFPSRSFHWAVILALNTAFVFYLHQHFNPEHKLQLLYLAGWGCLVLSIYLALFVPSCGIDNTVLTPSWRGVYGQKNICAMATVFWLSVVFYLPVHSLLAKATRGAYIALSIFVVAMTHSVTSAVVLGCMVLYVIATLGITRFESKDRKIGMVVGVAILSAAAGTVAVHWAEFTYLFGKDPTLTGRSGIWDAAWASLMKHPLCGYGYRAFWSGYQGESANVALANGWAVSSAHNAFLQVWLDLGLLGLAGVFYALLRSVSSSISYLGHEASAYRGWCACAVFLTIAMSIDEAEFLIPNGLLWMMFILASVELCEKKG
jgi:O-antigen ligase